MPPTQLPDRPDLAQLRRQAKELHRAAAAGDPAAQARLRAGAAPAAPAGATCLTLAAAQLALAREHGFASWPRLKAEVDRRTAGRPHPPGDAPTDPPRSWRDAPGGWARLLEERTGAGVDAWNRRIRQLGAIDEAALRAWLAGQGVDGYPQMLLVMERFGYPDFLRASAAQLIDGQYADRARLRPVLDAVLAAAYTLGPVTVQARKTYVSLVSPRRTFAVVKATTRQRVDLGLRIDGLRPAGRLQDGARLGNGAINLRVALAAPADVDDEVVALLRRAYQANS